MESVGTTPLLDQWSIEFSARPGVSSPAWLNDLKQDAAKQFVAAGLPSRKTEAWKYTPLRLLEKQAPTIRVTGGQLADAAEMPESVCSLCEGIVDIRNGAIFGPLPEMPAGITLLPLAAAIEKFGDVLRKVLQSRDLSGSTNVFSALNTAFLDQGLVVHADANVQAGSLLIRWMNTDEKAAQLDNFRLIVLLEPDAKFDIVEQYEDVTQSASTLNTVIQVELAEGAELGHVRVQNGSEAGVLLTSTSVRQAARSRYRYSGFDLAGGLVRHELDSILEGEGAQAEFDGAFVLDRKRHVDNHISVDHVAQNCSSSQFFRGVLGGSSRGVFNGRALIRQGADGSSVRQSNANLLLSALAEMDTKPELEIYADEVEASHGATVGQLDEAAVFYLRTRGLSEEQSRRILTMAFCHAVTDRLEDRALAERISGMLDSAMPRNEPVAGVI